jgi:hypothetical protein
MKVKKIDGDIHFTDGSTIAFDHRQDCCEIVYADVNQLKDTSFMSEEFSSIEDLHIEIVDGIGVKINDYFIPCYNEQNGFYNGDVTVSVYNSEYELIKEVTIGVDLTQYKLNKRR